MHFTTTFLRGLGVVLPIALTVYCVVWVMQAGEAFMKPLALLLMPESVAYVPGSGLVLGVGLVYLAGLLVQLFVIEWLVGLGQRLFERTPFVRSLYNAFADFVSTFSRRPSETASRVVSVRLADDLSVIGFITDQDPSRLRAPGDPDDRVAVYLPMSYQIGGYTILVPRDRLRPLDLDIQDAMRRVLTAGVGGRADS
ncbi:DUF502 domain-containing protein [Myxococcota bacterium]|nr:DUF502 domain-containing protein [Myxococcota bacterium]